MSERTARDEVVVAAICEKRDALRGILRARMHPADVDDAFQVAAMRAVERAESLHDDARVLPWLYRLYRNVAIDVTRGRMRRQRIFDEAGEVPDRAEPELTDVCRCSMSQSKELAANYAAVLDLVDVGGLQLREAARVLDISVNNATVRLHRARKALRKRMFEHCGVTSPRDCLDCRCVYEGCCGVA